MNAQPGKGGRNWEDTKMRIVYARILPSLMMVLFVVGPGWGACPKGDLTGDCRIDYMDVKALAEQWLAPPGELADIDGLNGVEWRDLALLAQTRGDSDGSSSGGGSEDDEDDEEEDQ